MFNDVNKVTLIGNATGDPELRFLPSGAPVLNFSLATNRRYKKDEEWTDETTFHNIVVWGSLAENLAKRMMKGTRVYIEGRLQVRTWDGNDGKRNYKTEVVADTVNLLARFKEGSNADLETPAAATGSAMPEMQTGADIAAKQSSGGSSKKDEPTPDIDPDDLPF